MIEEEQIRQLQEELRLLSEQVKQNQQRIAEMQARLSNLIGVRTPDQAIRPKEWNPDSLLLENFIGLKLIHFAGIIVLVIGLSIGVKYAIDKNLISEMMRVALAYGAGLVLYMLSLRLRRKYILFSAILFSGSMASLYFTTYASYVYYSLFPFAFAFAIMIGLTIYTVYEAIRYDHSEIALLGLTGAYGIPFLISHNSDRADLYFFYILLINSGIIYLYIRKEWKNIGRVANLITWILFIGWAEIRYKPELKSTGVLFLFLFFILFVFMALSLKLLRQRKFTATDINYIFLNNIALYIGALILWGINNGSSDLSIITLAMSVFLFCQSLTTKYLWNEEKRMIRYLAWLSLTLFVLYIGFEWNGFTVTLLWLLTSVLLFVFGMTMKWGSIRMASIILMGVTLFKLVVFDSIKFTTVQKVISYLSLGVLLLIVSFFYQKFKEQLFGGDE